jgi:AcrR family transcriptional regulator
VAEYGYQALKVRDIARRAEVSTRAFYEHFGSKEDCFLQTYDLIARRATRRVIGAQSEERDWRKRPLLVFERFARELQNDPAGARFALIDAYAAGDESLAQAWRAERIFEGMLAECLARAPDGVMVSPLIVEGMVAGVAGVSKNRLRAGKLEDLRDSSQELADWVLCYPDEAAAELAKLDQHSVWRDTTLEPPPISSANGNGEPWPTTGDRALILTAVAELAATNGYAGVTAPRIRAAASVSRRKFDAYFDDVEDCYLAALEQRAGEALAQAARAQTAASSRPGGVYRAIAALCDHVAHDAFLARVCLIDDFPSGPNGARSRQRLADAVMELLNDTAIDAIRPTPLVTEASAAAIWSLFHHYIVRDWTLRKQISATLGYIALTPALGASRAVTAIRDEQGS